MLARIANRLARTPRPIRDSLVALGLLCPVVALACAVGSQDPEPAAEPPAPAAPPLVGPTDPSDPPDPSAPPTVAITQLRIGAAPFAWSKEAGVPGGRRLQSFITDTDTTCTVVAWAKAKGVAPESIRWAVTPPAGFALPAGPMPTGPKLRVLLTRAAGTPKGGGGPLSIIVRAVVQKNGRTVDDTATVTQDERDQMRQEYVDLRRADVPERHRFLDAAAYQQRYGRLYPMVRFEELNFSVNPATGGRYQYIIVSERLLQGLARARAIYGRELIFSSGYRNPTRQVEVHAPVKESLHQYGLAADLVVFPDIALPKTGRAAPNEADWLRFAESAVAAGASWVEPMTECDVNTVGCHLHMDFRPDGPRSRVLTLRGRVLDDETGEPVAGALVTFAGMPSRTDESGAFVVRNVLTPRERPVEVTAQGYQPLSQAVTTPDNPSPVNLRLKSGPRPRLAATFERAIWRNESAGIAVAEFRLRNRGDRAAQNLDLIPTDPAGLTTLVGLIPHRISAIQSAAGERLRLTVKVKPEAKPRPRPLVLRVAAIDPDGVARPQRLVCAWTPPAATPPAATIPRRDEISAAAVAAGAAGIVGAAGVFGAAAVARRRQARPITVQPATPASTAPATPAPASPTRPQPAAVAPAAPTPTVTPPIGDAEPGTPAPATEPAKSSGGEP
jgi:hypothetical protein